MKTTTNERIKLLRTNLKLNQIEFANEVGISPSLISKVEVGEPPSTRLLDKIIAVYAVPEEWLLQGKGELTYQRPSKESNPYKDALYKELRDQIDFLKETVRSLAGNNKSFRTALNQTGLSKGKRLRAAA